MAGTAAQAPTAVLQAALSRFHETAAAVAQPSLAAEGPLFIASAAFQGRKPGYFFGTGADGVGYYRDPEQPAPALEEALEDAGAVAKPQRVALDPEALLREAEEGVENLDEIGLLDLKGLRRLINLFERRFKDNMEMRMKYAEEPGKFMESEVDLDDAVKRMMVVAGSPELYPDFARTQAFADMLGLLGHENADIAADVLELFKELTEEDVVQDSEEEAIALVEAMLDANALELLVQRLTSLDESNDDEAAAVHHVLSIFENMVEVKPEVAELAVEKTKLLKWILGKVKQRGGEVDSNKQYTSELLAILMQHSERNQTRLGEMNGIDTILQAIAYYKNRDPKTSEEEEYLENLFDTLCTCLMQPKTRTLFFEAEGVELMAIILKQKRLARQGALKALDFATTRYAPACERLINMAGLKSLFAIFMGRSKLKHRKPDSMTVAEEEQRVVSVITNLLTNLGRGSRRDRVAAKFVESEFEKIDRLMEIYTEYQGRVAAEERRLATSGEEYTDEDMNLARLDAGLYTLQQCALIIGNLWLVGDVGIRKRVLTLLHQRSQTLADLRAVLKEHHDTLGDEGKLADDEKQKVKVERLLIAMGAQPADFEEAAEQPAAAAPAVNGQPEEASAVLPPGEDDMDMDMDVDADAGDAAAPQPPADAGEPAAAEPPAPSGRGREAEPARGDRGRKRSPEERERGGKAAAEPAEDGHRHDRRHRDRDRDRDRSSRRDADREERHDRKHEDRRHDERDRERKEAKGHKEHRDRDDHKHKRHKR